MGRVAQQKLALQGLYNCADIQQYPAEKLRLEFGKLGEALINYSQGIDNRRVEPHRERKSVAVERTFEKDLIGEEVCLAHLGAFCDELTRRLEKHLKEKVITKVGVKIKFADFTVKSSERKSAQFSLPLFEILLHHLLSQHPDKPVRLLGISVGLAKRPGNDTKTEQLSFNDEGFC